MKDEKIIVKLIDGSIIKGTFHGIYCKSYHESCNGSAMAMSVTTTQHRTIIPFTSILWYHPDCIYEEEKRRYQEEGELEDFQLDYYRGLEP